MYIDRYGIPSLLDTAPQGTVCYVHHQKEFDIYVQMGKNEEVPKWILMGTYNNDKLKSNMEYEIETFKKLKF